MNHAVPRDADSAASRARAAERPCAVAVLGPTATGKTAVSLAVAEALDGEIISVDSRQAWRGLEIGTAAPTPAERARVQHHGVAFLEPGERWSAGRFARLARRWLREIEARGRTPVLCGGTGFFFRALTQPLFCEPPLDRERRGSLREWLEARDPGSLVRWTRRLDPVLARRLGTVDPQRAARALEVALLTGRPLSRWQEETPEGAAPVEVRTWILALPAEVHRERIRRRAERALDGGWPGEARRLRETGHGPDSDAFTALGYPEALALAEDRISRAEAVEAIVRETWRYARRQRTWFRHQLPEAEVLDARRPPDELAARIVEAWAAVTEERRAAPRDEAGQRESERGGGAGG